LRSLLINALSLLGEGWGEGKKCGKLRYNLFFLAIYYIALTLALSQEGEGTGPCYLPKTPNFSD